MLNLTDTQKPAVWLLDGSVICIPDSIYTYSRYVCTYIFIWVCSYIFEIQHLTMDKIICETLYSYYVYVCSQIYL